MSTSAIFRKGSSLTEPREQPGRRRAGAGELASAAFLLMHVACLAVFLTGANARALTLCGACYLLQMVGITAGYTATSMKGF